MTPLINILIRVSRPKLFERCIQSCYEQTYTNWHAVLHADNHASYEACTKEVLKKNEDKTKYIGQSALLPYRPHTMQMCDLNGYHYNFYCNDLKKYAQENSWMFYLDDDDRLAHANVLAKIAEHLTDPDQPVICQFLRNGRPKQGEMYQRYKQVYKGRIGMPCLFLHSNHKNIADFVATEDADYRFIKTVTEKLRCKFVNDVVVDAGTRSHGQTVL